MTMEGAAVLLLAVQLCGWAVLTQAGAETELPTANAGGGAGGCIAKINFPGGDLPNMPVPAASAAACAALCDARDDCALYSFHQGGSCSDHGEHCAAPAPSGCCWLKSELAGVAANACTCSSLGSRGMPPMPPPAQQRRNLLYVLVDDLRTQLEPYGQTYMHTPNFQRLADGGTVFTRAFCQEAVWWEMGGFTCVGSDCQH